MRLSLLSPSVAKKSPWCKEIWWFPQPMHVCWNKCASPVWLFRKTKSVWWISGDSGQEILVCMAWNLPQYNHNFLIPVHFLKNRFYWWAKHQRVLKIKLPLTRQNWSIFSFSGRIGSLVRKNQNGNVKSEFYWLPDQTDTNKPPSHYFSTQQAVECTAAVTSERCPTPGQNSRAVVAG